MHILSHFPLCHLLDLTGCSHALLGALPNLPNYNSLAVFHSPHSSRPTPTSIPIPSGALTGSTGSTGGSGGVSGGDPSGAGAGAITNLHPDFLGYHMLPDDKKKLIQMVPVFAALHRHAAARKICSLRKHHLIRKEQVVRDMTANRYLDTLVHI